MGQRDGDDGRQQSGKQPADARKPLPFPSGRVPSLPLPGGRFGRSRFGRSRFCRSRFIRSRFDRRRFDRRRFCGSGSGGSRFCGSRFPGRRLRGLRNRDAGRVCRRAAGRTYRGFGSTRCRVFRRLTGRIGGRAGRRGGKGGGVWHASTLPQVAPLSKASPLPETPQPCRRSRVPH